MDNKKEYNQLLKQFSNVEDLISLIDEVILQDALDREVYYNIHKKYPEKRDLLGKLKVDLLTTKQWREQQNNK